MRYFLTFLLLFTTLQRVLTQSSPYITLKEVSPKTMKLYQKANSLYKSDQYLKAKIQFEKILKKQPNFIDANIQLASVYYEINDYNNAEKYFEKAVSLSQDYNPKIFYTLALCNRNTKKYDEAKNNLKQFIERDKVNVELKSKAIELYPNFVFTDSATKSPSHFNIQEAWQWNSNHSEYLPTISADGNTVVFTRRINENNEDLYITYRKDTSWTIPKSIEEINTLYNEGAPAISPDGRILVFTSCDIPESYGGCDLFISEYKDNEWSLPRNLSRDINTPGYESQANFADNGNTLYFVSNRKGGFGGYDLWVSYRMKNLSWSKPKNLGPSINTAKDEDCPFMHPNGKTLYFSSAGYPGMGGKDIYFSTKDKNNQWSPVQNMGYPLNSILNEASFITENNGVQAYYSSDIKYENTSTKIGRNLDFYSMQIPEFIRPPASTHVTISILDDQTKSGLEADVTVFDLVNNVVFYEGKSSVTGQVFVVLPTGANYALHIKKNDYIFDNSHFECKFNGLPKQQQKITKYLHKLKSNAEHKAIILENIFFESASSMIKPESEFELNNLFQYLVENKNIKIKIIGHTDNIGNESDNQLLSSQRAKAVTDYLIQKGIETARISNEGKGESSPIDTNDTELGRRKNRRTEFLILSE